MVAGKLVDALSRPAVRLTHVSIAAIALAAAHLATLVVFRHSSSIGLLSDSLTVVIALFTAVVCFRASRGSYAIARPFWQLTGITFVLWSIGKSLLMYEFYYLGVASPGIVPLLIFFFSAAPMFVTIFISDGDLKDTINWEGILDAVQILVLLLIIYLFLIYVPLLTKGEQAVGPLEDQLLLGRNILLAAGLLTRAILSRSRYMRRLYIPVAIIIGAYAYATWNGNRTQAASNGPEVVWYDLAWSIPFCLVALTASLWRQAPEEVGTPRQTQRMSGVIFAYLPSLILPVMLLVKVHDVVLEQIVLGLAGLMFSIVLFNARLALAQWRQRLTMKALDASERQYRSLFERNMAGVYRSTIEGKLLDCNPAFASMFGYTREELRRLPMDALYLGGAEERAGKINELRASGPSMPRECCFRRKDGSAMWVVQNAGIERKPDGSEIFEGTLIDITETKLTNLAIEDWKRRYDAAVLASGQIIYDCDLVSGQTTFGGALQEILGYAPEEFAVNTEAWRALIHPEDRPKYRDTMERAVETSKPFDFEYRVRHKDGSYRNMREQGRVAFESGDAAKHLVSSIADITERRALEAQLRQAMKMEAVGRLAGGVAHDFNNLLTVITGYTELLLESAGPKETVSRERTEQIRGAAQRAASLTRQLLAFSRQQVLQPRKLNLNTVVSNLEKMLRRLIGEDIEVKTTLAENLDLVEVDPSQIEQVLMNLAVNARDAMPNGGVLTLETANVRLDEAYKAHHGYVVPGDYVRLTVSDTGVGMDAEVRARIFEPFFTTKEAGKGTGLGLSTVYGVVKQSGGYIEVYSEPGLGTSFKIHFPRVARSVEDTGRKAQAATHKRGSETILLVEDNDQLRDLAALVLTSQGYRVLPAAKIEEVEAICKRERGKIDLLLTDVVMPRISGTEIARLVSQRRPGIRILYMSGYTADTTVHHGVLEHGVAFLQKPFTPATLATKVREVLDQPAQG
jgi:two-component system cell cycle sensor histidine kinase/response regulator CckA